MMNCSCRLICFRRNLGHFKMLEMIRCWPTCWQGMLKYRLQWSGQEGREWWSTRWTLCTSRLNQFSERKWVQQDTHDMKVGSPIRADLLEEYYWQSLYKLLRGCQSKRRSGQSCRLSQPYICLSSLDNLTNWYLHSLKNSHPKVKEDDTVHGGTGAILLSIYFCLVFLVWFESSV